MAQMYGGRAYTPNPGITLNSGPQFSMPQAPAAPQMGGGMNGLSSLFAKLNANPKIAASGGIDGILQFLGQKGGAAGLQQQFDQGLGAMFPGQAQTPQMGSPGQPGMDRVAAAYAKFMNGGR